MAHVAKRGSVSRKRHAKAPYYSSAKRDRYLPTARVRCDPVTYKVSTWLNYQYLYQGNQTARLVISMAQLPLATYQAYATIWDEYMIDKVTFRLAVQDNQDPANPTTYVTPTTFDCVMAPLYAISTTQDNEALLANNNHQHQKYINPNSGNNTMDYTIYPRVQLSALNNAGTAGGVVTQRSWVAFTGDQATETQHWGLLLRVGQLNGTNPTPGVEVKVKFHLKLRSQ